MAELLVLARTARYGPKARQFFTFLSNQARLPTNVSAMSSTSHLGIRQHQAQFSTTRPALKKKDKKQLNKKQQASSSSATTDSEHSNSAQGEESQHYETTPAVDAADMTPFISDLDAIQARLKSNLAVLGPGGSGRANLISSLEELAIVRPASGGSGGGGSDSENIDHAASRLLHRKVLRGDTAAASTSASGSGGSGGSTSTSGGGGHQGGKGNSTMRVGDVAQIVARGREMHFLLSMADGAASSVGGKGPWAKAIDSAVQKAGLGLVSLPTPTPMGRGGENSGDEDGPKLVYAIPIRTAESRQREAERAEGWKKEALEQILNARQKRQKFVKGNKDMVKQPDMRRKVLAALDKAVQDANEAVKKTASVAQHKILNL